MLSRFIQFNIELCIDDTIIPEDTTTLFICSGMQNLKSRFRNPDFTKYGSLQSCIRTNDLDLVGDGSHLTYFQMLGNFSFGRKDYEESVELWHLIITDLCIDVDYVTVHPTRQDHKQLWQRLGYQIRWDEECVWSDGEVGGECCEIFSHGLEIGNLVNSQGHSTDVGFGWERLHQIVEQVNRVDEISLFDTSLHPIIRDHVRCLEVLKSNDIVPGNKGRNYVTRRLLRRILRLGGGDKIFNFSDWLQSEQISLDKRIGKGRTAWRKNSHQSIDWWWETFGILPEEISLLQG